MIKKVFLFILLFITVNKVYATDDLITLDNVYRIDPIQRCRIRTGKDDEGVDTNVRLTQGVYFFNRNGTDYGILGGAGEDTSPKYLRLVDLTTCSLVSNNNSKVLGHANDLTYNSDTGEFYVTTASAKINGKSYLDRFTIDDDLKIDFVPNGEVIGVAATAGVAYVESSDDSYNFIYQSGANFYKLEVSKESYEVKSKTLISNTANKKFDHIIFENLKDKNGKDINEIYFKYKYDSNNTESPYTSFVNQGMDYYNGNIYAARAINSSAKEYTAYSYTKDGDIDGYAIDSAYVLVFNANTGRYKYALYIPNESEMDKIGGVGFTGHLEGLSLIENRLLLSYNDHRQTPNKFGNLNKSIFFLEYDGIDQLEEKYHNITFNNNYSINNNILSKIDLGSIEIFLNNIKSNGEYSIKDKNGNIISNDESIKTGYSLEIVFSGDESDPYNKKYNLSVLGDVLGEGTITQDGIKRVARHIVDNDVLKDDDEYRKAADMNDDDFIKINDVMMMLKRMS